MRSILYDFEPHYKMAGMRRRADSDPLALFHPAARAWFAAAFARPTPPQALGWPAIARGESTLILAPTGTGKTLSAFLWCLNRCMFGPAPNPARRCRVLYISPLKALAVDVERNLRAPLDGIARVATARGDEFFTPTVSIRTGDTPAVERARFRNAPTDILITTPESLFLLLTSNARDALRGVDTIIIDEIHALVPTKRGAHLAISIERMAARCDRPPQRIGLSATQRPLDEVARFLGGAEPARARGASRLRSSRSRAGALRARAAERAIDDEFAAHASSVRYRPVTVVDCGARRPLSLRIEVPVEDMARLSGATPSPVARAAALADSLSSRGPQASSHARGAPPPLARAAALEDSLSSRGPQAPSIWSAIHPRLLELIRAHRSTLVFVNSRRLAERLAGALNELAGETLVRTHHGSIAREQRLEVEEALKAGSLRALVATSSLELGIDMGAIDLVVQIEAPPSVASGLQRIGRAGHQIDTVSEGVVFPKYRGDLVACAAVARAMREGQVEATRYPRNPLDIAAQQIVAMTAMDEWRVNDLYATIRRAAPFAELGRGAFEGVLDMLSGRYPSDEFAELRPRVTWDRLGGTAVARDGAKRVVIANAGTIPDRGLFGVFLAGAASGAARVGELDEEMVFETAVGETFVLGASSWRIEEITHDRVLVTPAPGEPGKMPFWKGDRTGRPMELGLAIGRLTRDLLRMTPAAAVDQLTRLHDLDTRAAEHLLQYLRDQMTATRAVPDVETVLIERLRDDLGDWRVCVLSPRGGRIHAPWAMAVAARIRETKGIDVETLWADDGFVVRFPNVDEPPDSQLLVPDPDEVQELVVRQLGATALFAAKFRENAARSLLLPKRRPGLRAPLWQQRKRAADLLAVASRFGSFPVVLETYRECLRDVFDMPALVATLSEVRSRTLRVVTVDSERPSPFAASLLFNYVASFLYDGDAPLAERRAQALAVDQAELRALIGDAELRELLDEKSIEELERELQRLDERFHARSPDGVHDLLLSIGDLGADELAARIATPAVAAAVQHLVAAGRVLGLQVAGSRRYVAVEDGVRYRDALGVSLPAGLPDALLERVGDPLADLALRFARTHAPFPASRLAERYGLTAQAAEQVLARLEAEGRLLQGEFRPGGTGREWSDAGVLRVLRRRSLATLRHEIAPVDHAAFGRFAAVWHGLTRRRRGADALLDVIEHLQGAPLAASILETDILAARVDQYDPADLDAVVSAGEVVWVGVEPLGERDGRIALYLADRLMDLHQRRSDLEPSPDEPRDRSGVAGGREPDGGSQRNRAALIVDYLRSHGASFFSSLHQATSGGYPGESVSALWDLVWRGVVTNDGFHALRAFAASRTQRRRERRAGATTFRSRRLIPASAEGRWSLVETSAPGGSRHTATRTLAALTQQLLVRHGVLTREAVVSEAVAGGFSAVYPVLKSMEEAGRLRRGYFVAGLGATQFALPGALDLLRAHRDGPSPEASVSAGIVLSATDPASPYGATVRWPAFAASAASARQARAADAASARPARGDDAAEAARGPTRTVGASVILVDGALGAYLARGDRMLLTWLPEVEPERSRTARHLAGALADRARRPGVDEGVRLGGAHPGRGMLLEEIDGRPTALHPLAPFLVEAGFIPGAMGFQAPRG